LRRLPIDVLHSGHPNATPIGTLPCPRIVTCHDLIPLLYPRHYASLGDGFAHGRRRLDQRRYHRADHVIAVSEATKQDLVRLLGVPADKISVVHNGVDLQRWRPEPRASDAAVRERLGLRAPYAVYAGAADFRKNADGMFAALARARSLADARLELVWAGSLREQQRERLTRLASKLGVREHVRLLGYVSDADLAALYRGATALLFVSRAEGFGYPLVEAMACGCPVLTSDRSSMAELARGAALLCDPEDTSAIAAALASLVGDESERARLRELGRVRAQGFSVERMAAGTAAVYRRVARG
jgi:glycosyltransferase involved in cell wall biosynthesis